MGPKSEQLGQMGRAPQTQQQQRQRQKQQQQGGSGRRTMRPVPVHHRCTPLSRNRSGKASPQGIPHTKEGMQHAATRVVQLSAAAPPAWATGTGRNRACRRRTSNPTAYRAAIPFSWLGASRRHSYAPPALSNTMPARRFAQPAHDPLLMHRTHNRSSGVAPNNNGCNPRRLTAAPHRPMRPPVRLGV